MIANYFLTNCKPQTGTVTFICKQWFEDPVNVLWTDAASHV